ncbi:Na+/melibiose symporter [Agromyces sp. CF514]|uniref:MFS transporter n=1 Tax=Agromyces sp. CF514 TaxID=1881031 RepID=UPI0008DEB1A7|nr:MFS transporter [Agromyces sp. CF514]SFR84475.1 Na+/melibiose symporter [Agromyces sp. CF514]
MSARTASPKAPRDKVPTTTEPIETGTSGFYLKGPGFRRYLTVYTLVYIGISAVWGAVLGIVLPNHVQLFEFANFFTGADAGVDLQQLTLLKQSIDDGTATATADQQRQLDILSAYESSKAGALAVITSIGAVVTMFVQPIVGVLSDRTRSRFGRRAPWILSGAIIGSALLVVARFSPTLAVLGLAIALAQGFLNMALAPLQTTVADRVTEERRGLASGLGGFGNFLGGLLGGILAGVFFSSVGLDIYLVVALSAAFTATLFVLLARDRSSLDLAVDAFNWKQFFVGFTVAVRDADFRWVFIARLLLTFGYTVSTALGLYLLQSYVRPALSASEATTMAPLLTLVGLPLTLIAMLLSGRISDKVGKRKPFVIVASIIMAASFLVPIISPTLPGLFIQVALAGLAFGIYIPVDQALFIDVLPDPRRAGRDLGVANLGSSLGQALGPLLASLVVVVTGGYLGIWIVAVVLVGLAALAIVPVKGAK